jgi:hypothetical protein
MMRVRHTRSQYFPPVFKEAALMLWGEPGPIRCPGGHGPYWQILGKVLEFVPESAPGVDQTWFT